MADEGSGSISSISEVTFVLKQLSICDDMVSSPMSFDEDDSLGLESLNAPATGGDRMLEDHRRGIQPTDYDPESLEYWDHESYCPYWNLFPRFCRHQDGPLLTGSISSGQMTTADDERRQEANDLEEGGSIHSNQMPPKDVTAVSVVDSKDSMSVERPLGCMTPRDPPGHAFYSNGELQATSFLEHGGESKLIADSVLHAQETGSTHSGGGMNHGVNVFYSWSDCSTPVSRSSKDDFVGDSDDQVSMEVDDEFPFFFSSAGEPRDTHGSSEPAEEGAGMKSDGDGHSDGVDRSPSFVQDTSSKPHPNKVTSALSTEIPSQLMESFAFDTQDTQPAVEVTLVTPETYDRADSHVPSTSRAGNGCLPSIKTAEDVLPTMKSESRTNGSESTSEVKPTFSKEGILTQGQCGYVRQQAKVFGSQTCESNVSAPGQIDSSPAVIACRGQDNENVLEGCCKLKTTESKNCGLDDLEPLVRMQKIALIHGKTAVAVPTSKTPSKVSSMDPGQLSYDASNPTPERRDDDDSKAAAVPTISGSGKKDGPVQEPVRGPGEQDTSHTSNQAESNSVQPMEQDSLVPSFPDPDKMDYYDSILEELDSSVEDAPSQRGEALEDPLIQKGPTRSTSPLVVPEQNQPSYADVVRSLLALKPAGKYHIVDNAKRIHAVETQSEKYGAEDIVPKRKVDVCLVIDCSAPMTKFMAPLRRSLSLFLQFLSLPTLDLELRVACSMASGCLGFTPDVSAVEACVDAMVGSHKSSEQPGGSGGELEMVMKKVQEMQWSCDAAPYVFLLTNVAGLNDIKDAEKKRRVQELGALARYIPRRAIVGVGTWLSCNGLLVSALSSKRLTIAEFPMLQARNMASIVAGVELLPEVMNPADLGVEKTRSLKFASKLAPKSQSPVQLDDCALFGSVRNATQFQLRPFNAIEDVQLEIGNVPNRTCFTKRTEQPFFKTTKAAFYRAKLGIEKFKWNEDVTLECPVLDVVSGKSNDTSQAACASMLLSSTVARFLAIEYNRKHRPEHCLKINVCKSYMIKEQTGEEYRVFFAEKELPTGEFKHFCTAAGKWNEGCLDESLLRFAQTSFKLSGGDFIVAGLKGVACGGIIHLTNPVILSRNMGGGLQSECNKIYMKNCRTEAKALMERHGWNRKLERKQHLMEANSSAEFDRRYEMKSEKQQFQAAAKVVAENRTRNMEPERKLEKQCQAEAKRAAEESTRRTLEPSTKPCPADAGARTGGCEQRKIPGKNLFHRAGSGAPTEYPARDQKPEKKKLWSLSFL